MASLVKSVEFKDKFIVLSNGDIYIKRKKYYQKLKQHIKKNGYLQATMEDKSVLVHRIIMEAFYGKSKLQVDHINMNKQDNELSNLEYVTSQENVKRMNEKLYIPRAIKVIYKGKIYNSQRALSRELGVYSDVVSKALKNNKLLLGYEITKVTK